MPDDQPIDQSTPQPTMTTRRTIALVACLFVSFWLVLWSMGREFLSDSGFGVWTGAWTENTSQWIVDPYTASHVLHGIFFCWFLWPLRGRFSIQSRFLVAALIEAGWEILENSPIVIDRYRAATASLEYYGDSIMNSTCDLLAAMFGFWLASTLPWKWALAIVIASELICLYFVRDNLTLNILMLVHPSDAIKEWQMAR